MTTREAIKAIAGQLTDEWVVCTTGYTCRDMQAVADRAANFYMIGSMGVAASIGLGLALRCPNRSVVVLDGDGAVLMGLGNLPMIGVLTPKNLIHVVLDNEVFASTGGQMTYARRVSLDGLAKSSGYPLVERVDRLDQISGVWRQVSQRKGPAFILLKCQPDAGPPMERVRLAPEEITSRFKEAAHGTTQA